MRFPQGFVWGAATASYQIEGAAQEDGRGLSIWDVFSHRPGVVRGGHTGDIADDHYHRWREDIALMQGMGLSAYRFSIAWPRILPAGKGAVNPAGLAFYDRLVDELLRANIQPYVTLYHWDMPYELYCQGGWLNNDSSDWFADYTRVVVERLGDRVQHWMTINEPQVMFHHGMTAGVHAPGDRLNIAAVLRAGHNCLLAHGKAVQVIRATSRIPGKVGMAPVGVVFYPETESEADIAAARECTFAVDAPILRENPFTSTAPNLWNNAWWADPICLGTYPQESLDALGADAPVIRPGDMETIHQPLDFYACNIYSGTCVRAGTNGPEVVPYPLGGGLTAYDWIITPEALYWGPRFFHERYHLPVMITENGLANTDWPAMDGRVHDPQRIDFTRRYLLQLRRAAAEGIPLAGYFHWSLLDNFEWGEGYQRRFGLIHVDYTTQQRTPKDSAHWYQQVIASNGEILDENPGTF